MASAAPLRPDYDGGEGKGCFERRKLSYDPPGVRGSPQTIIVKVGDKFYAVALSFQILEEARFPVQIGAILHFLKRTQPIAERNRDDSSHIANVPDSHESVQMLNLKLPRGCQAHTRILRGLFGVGFGQSRF
jgi:hypothetical protein